MREILRQIWRFLRIAASGPGSLLSLTLVAVVAACQLAGIQIGLSLIQWYADFYNALQKLDATAAVSQMGVFALLIGTSAMLFLVSQFLRKTVQLRWRRRLTDVLLTSWMAHQAYWMLDPGLGDRRSVDNPDQRISEDANLFLASLLGGEGARTGVLDFIMNLIGLFSYGALLWQLSTFDLSFSLFGQDVVVPKYMFWIAPVYVVIATFLTHVLGRELPGLLAEEQKREADFRFALMRVRENASAIALSGGEGAERQILSRRFEGVVNVWRSVIRREFIYGLFQRPYFQTVLRIPMFFALPAFLAGKVTLGGLMQIAQAFQNVVTTLSWFIFNYKFVSDLVATTQRLALFYDATEATSAARSGPMLAPSSDGALRVSQLAIRAPDGRPLLAIAELNVAPGQTIWLRGASGLGKSTLFKTLAGLWPHASGTVQLPSARILFMPQQVYLPLDTLAAAAIYPALPGALAQSDIDALLHKVGLGHRTGLDATNGLSVGEQQRLALARVIAAKPDWVFLDEATSALDLDAERRLMTLLRNELPKATFVIVAHREPQGLTGVIRIELSGPDAPSTSEEPIETRLTTRTA